MHRDSNPGLEKEPDASRGGSHIAVVLIHGIGDVGAGDVTAAAIKGIRAALPDVTIPAAEETDASNASRAQGSTALPRTRLQWRDSIVDLVEFPWAGIAGKIRLRRPVRALGQITGVIREFPSMAVSPGSPRSFRFLAAFIGYLLAALWLCWLASMAGSLIELALRTEPWIKIDGNTIGVVSVTSELFKPGNPWFLENGYYWSYAASWLVVIVSVLGVGLAEVFGFLFLVSLLVPRLRPLNVLIRTSAASGFVAYFFCLIFGLAHAPAAQYIASVTGGDGLLLLTVIGVVFLAILCVAFLVALIPANLLRDVVHYLGTNSAGARLADQQEIHDRLRRMIDDLRQSPTLDRIVLVCHSLGTVVVADFLLSENASGHAGRPTTVDLITAGSPIRRLINLLLPHRLPGPLEIRRQLDAGMLPVARWFNCYRVGDYVGKRLVPLRGNGSDPQNGICECPLRPRWRWPWGHANYWADTRFVRLVAADVLAPVLEQTTAKDWRISTP